jgi:hypothetical protein
MRHRVALFSIYFSAADDFFVFALVFDKDKDEKSRLKKSASNGVPGSLCKD